ncbi:genetic suppressor element 1-like isoform X3 [Acanthaster planci]|uniref:Genetic suppressor element 1-like isoform X3 n=1 Tax=Acanthaster planci TaxID=133434 RepID=A0A8B7XUG6_ACAPL|nr:genetic suppressor element 1-like isoform X3 [Acanthaster planci]
MHPRWHRQRWYHRGANPHSVPWRRPISNNRERKPGEGRNESVIVIDSDSDGEREHVSLHHHGNPDSVQSSLSPKSGSSSNSRPASEGAPSHGAKPPPLTVVTSSSSKATRTTATVNPLNQSASTVTVTSANSTNHAMAATRTSSFAAALRKLAKHANDNGPEEHSPRVSPVSMNRSTASTPSTKNFHFGPSPLVVPTSTPPVVTIAPTHTNNSSLMSEQRRLSQELDRHGHHNSSEQHNSSRHPSESSSAPNSIWRSKGSPGAGPRSRPVPQHLKPEESNPVRGFQPYRSGETEMTPRPPAPAPPPPPPPPSHLTYDPAMMAAALSPYPFHQAFMGPPHMPYHSFRPEDSYDRYSSYPGLRPPPFIPFSSPPSHLFPHPAINPLAFSGMRYSGDLAAMQLSHLSPGVSFGGLVSPSAQHEREKLLLDQQRDRERRAEEAKQEAAQKEKQQQQQRETERENHDRALLSRSHEDKRCSPRDGSHLRHSSSHHHNHHHHHHHHQQLAHSQHHLGTPRVPSSTSASTPSSSGHRDPEQSPLPLLKKADVEDRWQSKHLKDGSSGDAQYRHVRNSQATSHENHVSHTSEKERKSSLHHERELLLQQDRRIAERHEKERNLLREQRNQARGEHHHSGRPPPLVSPVRPTREEMYRHKLFNNHRPSGQDTVIPPQYDYERLNNVDRILLNDKSSVSASGTTAATTTSAAEKAWYEQQRTMMASRVQSPHGSTAREFDHEARVVVTNSHGPQPPGVATHSKSSHLSQYDYDRPHAEFNYHWQDLYRLSQQVRDHSGVQLNEVGEPVVSKLDLEGRKRTETRANGIYISSESDSDSEEETEVKRQRYRKRMHRIVRKSCMTLDDSEKKTNFFQVMGLVTHGKKEEISEEKRRKRRLWLKEEQPPAKVSRPSSELVSLLPAPASLSQEDFQRELDYPHKCRFLRGLGLDVVGVDKRKEMEKARAAVEAYRIRQAKKKEAAAEGETKGESVSTAGSSETAQTPTTPTNSGTDSKVETSENPQCKTAFGETFPNHLVSSSPGVQAHTQNERTLPSGGSSTPQTRTPDNSLHPVPGKQLSLSDRDIKKEPAAGSERADLARSSSNNNRSGTTADQQGPGGALPFSTAALLSRGGPSVGGAGKPPSQFEGFAQEFHQSVLRTTQEAMAQQRVGSLGSNSSSLVQVDAQRRDRHAFAGLTNSNSESTGSGRSNGTVWSKGQLQWPGVEAVMDSYQRHAKEQELERSVLLDQQGRLRVCNGELNSTAEQLRLKMADMMERKQLLHREQEAYLRDLHHLQKYVYNMRK